MESSFGVSVLTDDAWLIRIQSKGPAWLPLSYRGWSRRDTATCMVTHDSSYRSI